MNFSPAASNSHSQLSPVKRRAVSPGFDHIVSGGVGKADSLGPDHRGDGFARECREIPSASSGPNAVCQRPAGIDLPPMKFASPRKEATNFSRGALYAFSACRSGG